MTEFIVGIVVMLIIFATGLYQVNKTTPVKRKAHWLELPRGNYDCYFAVSCTEIAVIATGTLTISFDGASEQIEALCMGRVTHIKIPQHLIGVPFKLHATGGIQLAAISTQENVHHWSELR